MTRREELRKAIQRARTLLHDTSKLEKELESLPDEPVQGLLAVAIDELMTSAPPAPFFVIERLVPASVVTLLGGHGGAGKSLLGLTLAAHVAGGAHTWAGYRIEDGRALYVSLEDPGDVVRWRLRKIIEAYGLDAERVARRLVVVDGTEGNTEIACEVSDHGQRQMVLTSAYTEIRELALGARLIVVDNASDGFGGNENERRAVRFFIRALARIAKENEAGLILLAHIDKAAARMGAQGNTYSGSTQWHNSVRSRLALVANEGVVELVAEKLNLGKKVENPISLTWTEGGVLLPVSRSADDSKPADAEHVIAAMRAARAAGVDVGAARTGSVTTHTALATFDELPAHLQGARGKRAFWSAVGKLQASGAIQLQEIVTGQRKKKNVLVLTECAEAAANESARAESPHPYALNSAHRDAGSVPVCAEGAPKRLAQTSAGERERPIWDEPVDV